MVLGVSVVYNRAFPSTESEILPKSEGGKKKLTLKEITCLNVIIYRNWLKH